MCMAWHRRAHLAKDTTPGSERQPAPRLKASHHITNDLSTQANPPPSCPPDGGGGRVPAVLVTPQPEHTASQRSGVI